MQILSTEDVFLTVLGPAKHSVFMTTTIQKKPTRLLTLTSSMGGGYSLQALHDALHSSNTQYLVHTITQQGQVYIHLLALVPSPSLIEHNGLTHIPTQQITDTRSLSPE